MILKSSTDCAITVCFHGHYREALLTSILLGVDDLLSRHIAHLFIRDPSHGPPAFGLHARPMGSSSRLNPETAQALRRYARSEARPETEPSHLRLRAMSACPAIAISPALPSSSFPSSIHPLKSISTHPHIANVLYYTFILVSAHLSTRE